MVRLIAAAAAIAVASIPHIKAEERIAVSTGAPAAASCSAVDARVAATRVDRQQRLISRTVLSGPEAAAYLQAKLNSDASVRAGFEKATANMIRRGFQPTNAITVVAERRERLAPAVEPQWNPFPGFFLQLRDFFFPVLKAQTDGGAYEDVVVIWEEWDDGYSPTWEGTQYYEDTLYGFWEITEEQVDLSNEREDIMWAYLGASSDGREHGPREVRHDPRSTARIYRAQVWGSGQCGCGGTFWDRFCVQQEIAGCHLFHCGTALADCIRQTRFPVRNPWISYRSCVLGQCGVSTFECVKSVNRFYALACR